MRIERKENHLLKAITSLQKRLSTRHRPRE